MSDKSLPKGTTHTITEFGRTDYIKYEYSSWYVWQNRKWVPLHPIVLKGYRDRIKSV